MDEYIRIFIHGFFLPPNIFGHLLVRNSHLKIYSVIHSSKKNYICYTLTCFAVCTKRATLAPNRLKVHGGVPS